MAILGQGGGGTPLNYIEATQNMVLEANSKYLIPEGVTNVILPDTAAIEIGDAVIISQGATSVDPTISAYSTGNDTILYNDTVYGFYGAGSGNPTAQLTMNDAAIELYWNGTTWQTLPTTTAFNTAASNFYQIMFTSSGSFTVPTGVNNNTLKVTVVGGGGGGGGETSTVSQNGGGGGGGGAVIYEEEITVTAGTTYTVTVGAGGAGGANLTAGGDGGDSSFGTLLIAGGGGGGNIIGTSSVTTGGAGGAGGTVSGSITPTYGFSGGAGGEGFDSSADLSSTTGKGGDVTNTATSTTYEGGLGADDATDGGGGGGGASALAEGQDNWRRYYISGSWQRFSGSAPTNGAGGLGGWYNGSNTGSHRSAVSGGNGYVFIEWNY